MPLAARQLAPTTDDNDAVIRAAARNDWHGDDALLSAFGCDAYDGTPDQFAELLRDHLIGYLEGNKNTAQALGNALLEQAAEWMRGLVEQS